MKAQNILFIFICINMLFGIDYEAHIQPVFNQSCITCHGNSGGLNLESYENLMSGDSDNGPVIIPDDHQQSELWLKIESGEMPQSNDDLSDAMVQRHIHQKLKIQIITFIAIKGP